MEPLATPSQWRTRLLAFVDGQSIDLHARQQGLDITARPAWLQVAGATAHAHSRLLVHRDL